MEITYVIQLSIQVSLLLLMVVFEVWTIMSLGIYSLGRYTYCSTLANSTVDNMIRDTDIFNIKHLTEKRLTENMPKLRNWRNH